MEALLATPVDRRRSPTAGRWVRRRDIFGKPQGDALHCHLLNETATEQGLYSVEECVQMLLSADERCVGDTEHRLVMRKGRVVGHIDATRERPTD